MNKKFEDLPHFEEVAERPALKEELKDYIFDGIKTGTEDEFLSSQGSSGIQIKESDIEEMEQEKQSFENKNDEEVDVEEPGFKGE